MTIKQLTFEQVLDVLAREAAATPSTTSQVGAPRQANPLER